MFQLGQQAYGQSRLDEALGYFLQDLSLTRSEVSLGTLFRIVFLLHIIK